MSTITTIIFAIATFTLTRDWEKEMTKSVFPLKPSRNDINLLKHRVSHKGLFSIFDEV